MLLSNTISVLALLGAATATRSAKRGLIYIPNADTPVDNQDWTESGSDLTWYYNYGPSPSPYLVGKGLEFVPMLFTAPASTSDTSFLDGVKALIKSGTNVSYVLSYNEPDGGSDTGGSNLDPVKAAAAWIRELEPLRGMGIKLGAPACTGGSSGFTWLTSFFNACNGGCTPDFIPIHWYGNFEGLASHMGQVRGLYPNITMWITEYALAHSNLSDTQHFFNTSAEYYDRLDFVERYSYFGSFRSSKSNVGPNAAMLDQDGKLTDIGSWYLGGSATGNVPSSSSSTGSSGSGNSGTPNGGVMLTIGGAWALFVVGICFSVL